MALAPWGSSTTLPHFYFLLSHLLEDPPDNDLTLPNAPQDVAVVAEELDVLDLASLVATEEGAGGRGAADAAEQSVLDRVDNVTAICGDEGCVQVRSDEA